MPFSLSLAAMRRLNTARGSSFASFMYSDGMLTLCLLIGSSSLLSSALFSLFPSASSLTGDPDRLRGSFSSFDSSLGLVGAGSLLELRRYVDWGD